MQSFKLKLTQTDTYETVIEVKAESAVAAVAYMRDGDGFDLSLPDMRDTYAGSAQEIRIIEGGGSDA